MPKEKLDLSNLSEVDLESKIEEQQLRLKRLKFSHAVSPIENPMMIRGARREIARLKTELRKRELQPQQQETQQ